MQAVTLPTSSKVDRYRNEIGMNPCDKTAAQKGCYQKVIREERRANILYHIILSFVEFGMIGQILIGASLTALTASGSFPIPSTVLAALATVIAGVLAYLRAQGQPQRLHSYRAALRRVRDYADNMELRYLQEAESSAPEDQANAVYTMYIAARKDNDENQPDIYQTTTESTAAQPVGLKGTTKNTYEAMTVKKMPSYGVQRMTSGESRLEAGEDGNTAEDSKAAVRWF